VRPIYFQRWGCTYEDVAIRGTDDFTLFTVVIPGADFLRQMEESGLIKTGYIATDTVHYALRSYLDKTFTSSYGLAKKYDYNFGGDYSLIIAIHNERDLFSLRLAFGFEISLLTVWDTQTKFFMRIAKDHDFVPQRRDLRKRQAEDPHGLL
jgi:hypothetical protein